MRISREFLHNKHPQPAFWVVFVILETFEYFFDLRMIDWSSRKSLIRRINRYFFALLQANYRQKISTCILIDQAYLNHSKVIDVICNKKTCKQDRFVPDPRDFDLPEDFIYVENEWGSLFYKHLGNMTRKDGKTTCSSFGSSVHLPIPRFLEEYQFYGTYFGYNFSIFSNFKG